MKVEEEIFVYANTCYFQKTQIHNIHNDLRKFVCLLFRVEIIACQNFKTKGRNYFGLKRFETHVKLRLNFGMEIINVGGSEFLD